MMQILLISYTVEESDNEINLTKTEFSILKLLAQNRGRVFSIEHIYENVWRQESILNAENMVPAYIKKLREKIEDDNKNRSISKRFEVCNLQD